MQKFNFHCHTNFDCFDGKNTAKEMIAKAKEVGFTSLGISNHLHYHPFGVSQTSMFFNNAEKVLDLCKANAENIREAAQDFGIDVYVGYEVDYSLVADWHKFIERLKNEVDVDYLIGSSHDLRTKDEKLLFNKYHVNRLSIGDDMLSQMLFYDWHVMAEAVKSGLFEFMCHFDLYKIFPYSKNINFDEQIWEFIEVLDKYNQAYEINTSGVDKCGEQHPKFWAVEELCKRGVPVVISDDAHHVSHVGRYFSQAEEMLKKAGCSARWSYKK